MTGRQLFLPAERVGRWLDNFAAGHGTVGLGLDGGTLVGVAQDGSGFRARAPFGRRLDAPEPALLADACVPPELWGVLLVRKGGFAVARLSGRTLVEHKIGQRHVQGRTKAGGQSQQRFARRRDNQARQAYEAAAGHAARILAGVGDVVLGGDRSGVEAVLADPRLSHVSPTGDFLAVADPKRRVLDQAILDACSIRMSVTNVG